MPKLYHHEGRWLVPGQQDRKAARVDVPASPPDLAAWLNERDVRPDTGKPEGWLSFEQIDQHYSNAEPQLAEACNTSSRCSKCNALLLATEAAAQSQAHGNMLAAISEWLDGAPLWAVDSLEVQLAERRQA